MDTYRWKIIRISPSTAFEGIRSLAPVQYRRKSFRRSRDPIVAQGRSVLRSIRLKKM
jgi:hypothetical protein